MHDAGGVQSNVLGVRAAIRTASPSSALRPPAFYNLQDDKSFETRADPSIAVLSMLVALHDREDGTLTLAGEPHS